MSCLVSLPATPSPSLHERPSTVQLWPEQQVERPRLRCPLSTHAVPSPRPPCPGELACRDWRPSRLPSSPPIPSTKNSSVSASYTPFRSLCSSRGGGDSAVRRVFLLSRIRILDPHKDRTPVDSLAPSILSSVGGCTSASFLSQVPASAACRQEPHSNAAGCKHEKQGVSWIAARAGGLRVAYGPRQRRRC